MINDLPDNKTKIVATIGPASSSRETIAQLVDAGLNIARLNLAHGDRESHTKVVETLRSVSEEKGKLIAIMADLPGPKMRLGKLEETTIALNRGETAVLDTSIAKGNRDAIPVDFPGLADAVSVGNVIYLKDGYLQFEVTAVEGAKIICLVLEGGDLNSHSGVNLPGIKLSSSALTDNDRELMRFVLELGVDAVSVSFVQDDSDIIVTRELAASWGYAPFIIAKIERSQAVTYLDRILMVADGIMVARGDLGVETPISSIAVTQKHIIRQAKLNNRPVITATQMLESMIHNRRPTRAESTDVANAILDGTDCVMLSGESAVGDYPVDAVKMMATICCATEAMREQEPIADRMEMRERDKDAKDLPTLLAFDVAYSVQRVKPVVVIAPTESGATAQRLANYKLPAWVVAFCHNEKVRQRLIFSYGVLPQASEIDACDWRQLATDWCHERGLTRGRVLMTHGSSPANPKQSTFIEVFKL